tara:strand:+ start:3561 stop:4745 length:1185 start_codon:yes stop_codon:yes gene_type:complete
MPKYNNLEDLDVKGKRVFVRVDYNVPFDEETGEILDDTRIRASLDTVNYLIGEGAKVVLATHVGRPKGKVEDSLRTDKIGERLEELIDKEVKKLDDCVGAEVDEAVNGMQDGDVVLLENLRFHKGEEANDNDFAEGLARLAEVYVNDAFGTMHRAHASTDAVPRLVKKAAAGYLVQNEIDLLSGVLDSPEMPFYAVVGGAKVPDKIKVIENLLKLGKVLIGGGMVFTFFKVMGYEIGNSLLEKKCVGLAEGLIGHENLVLPTDVAICQDFDGKGEVRYVGAQEIEKGWIGLDIGPESIAEYQRILKDGKTVIWAGPMGRYEVSKFAKGTEGVAKAMAAIRGVSIVGGGDSAAAIETLGYSKEMTHISTGGSAFLEFMEGKTLPGIQALVDCYRK